MYVLKELIIEVSLASTAFATQLVSSAGFVVEATFDSANAGADMAKADANMSPFIAFFFIFYNN